MTDRKKNQHYIPKFYLRNFSYQSNGKQIGLFNLKSEKYIGSGKLKSQGSEDFYYGRDGHWEEELAKVETHLSKIVSEIIKTKQLPKVNSEQHYYLTLFVCLTHSRNPGHIDALKGFPNAINQKLFADGIIDESILVSESKHDEAIDIAFSILPQLVTYISDLKYKLLINQSSNSFITSDFPVIKYNKFLEERKWPRGRTGYGNIGLQIFIPLDSKITITFYDPDVYKIGVREKDYLNITNSSDVDQLNLLQMLHCYESVFFNETVSEVYVRELFERSRKFGKPNQNTITLAHLINGRDENPLENEKRNLIITGTTECGIKLNLQGLKMNSKSRKIDLGEKASPLRPHFEKLRKNDERTFR